MSISKDLFLAILSMDSYNRGYNAGIDFANSDASDGSAEIGTATVSYNLNDAGISQAALDAGFYAVAYTISGSVNIPELNGETVISYRGTDEISGDEGDSDAWNGWLIGAGVTNSVWCAA
ncbi:hypothetical protein [Hoeflea sp. TYP-13]|uniref:hypothetical protein n=1 Tax=Hoeflea sp. TYP-13 TaxID=3230023 RepID=UPI0034C5E522